MSRIMLTLGGGPAEHALIEHDFGDDTNIPCQRQLTKTATAGYNGDINALIHWKPIAIFVVDGSRNGAALLRLHGHGVVVYFNIRKPVKWRRKDDHRQDI